MCSCRASADREIMLNPPCVCVCVSGLCNWARQFDLHAAACCTAVVLIFGVCASQRILASVAPIIKIVNITTNDSLVISALLAFKSISYCLFMDAYTMTIMTKANH